MPKSYATPAEYLASLPDDRRRALAAVRKTIRANLGKGFKEGIQYGMIGYFVPHSVYPAGYHCDPKQPLPFAGLASQKNHMALYLFCLYTGPGAQDEFAKAWKATGKKLDMGKSCIRFKKIEDVPLEVIGDAIHRISARQFIESYEDARSSYKRSTKRTVKKKAKKTTKKVAKRSTKSRKTK